MTWWKMGRRAAHGVNERLATAACGPVGIRSPLMRHEGGCGRCSRNHDSMLPAPNMYGTGLPRRPRSLARTGLGTQVPLVEVFFSGVITLFAYKRSSFAIIKTLQKKVSQFL